ncbi:unnamed protein product, partial [Effrenium voratum]
EPLRVMRVDIGTGRCSEVSLVSTPALHALNPHADEFRGHGGPALVELPDGQLLGMARVQSGNLLYSHFFFTLVTRPLSVSQVSGLICFAARQDLCEVIQFVGGIHLQEGQLARRPDHFRSGAINGALRKGFFLVGEICEFKLCRSVLR